MITPSENNKFQNVFLNLNSSRFSLSIFSLVAVSACRSPYILQNKKFILKNTTLSFI